MASNAAAHHGRVLDAASDALASSRPNTIPSRDIHALPNVYPSTNIMLSNFLATSLWEANERLKPEDRWSVGRIAAAQYEFARTVPVDFFTTTDPRYARLRQQLGVSAPESTNAEPGTLVLAGGDPVLYGERAMSANDTTGKPYLGPLAQPHRNTPCLHANDSVPDCTLVCMFGKRFLLPGVGPSTPFSFAGRGHYSLRLD